MKRKVTRFLSFCLSAAMLMSAFGLMPEKTVQAAETDYTYTAFEDDFSDVAASSEKWSQSPDIRDGKLTVPTGVLYNIKDKQFDNVVYEMDISLNSQGSDDWIGLLFNRTAPEDKWDNSGCMVYLRGNNNAGALDVMGMDAEYKYEDHKIPGYSAGESVHLKIYQEEGNIEISANDTLILTAETASTGGYAGIYISSNSGSTSGTLDNVVIKTKPPVQDGEEEIASVFNSIKEGLDNSAIYIDSDQISGMPKVREEGYSFSMVKSSDESVVTEDGKVIPPSEEKKVTVTYELKYEFDGEVIKSEEYAVEYTVKEKTTSEDIAHFLDDKYGLFVHYVWAGQRRIGAGGQPEQISARYPDGTHAKTIDEMIENFDAEQFAQDCEDMGMQYVIFTVWHYGMNPVYPSEVYKEWRTHEEGDLPTDDGQHDLIDKVYQELDKKGIDLYLYTHPYDIHDLYDEDKAKFDYKYNGDLTFDYDGWNDYLNAQYKELCERYKGKIKGMFLDEGLANPANNLSVDYPRLRDTVKSVDPSLVMMQNEYNGKYSCDTSMWELPTAWHGGNYNDLGSWQTNTIPIGTSVGNIYQGYSWWAVKNRGDGTQGLETAENAYIYTVLQAGTNTEGGGMAWAAGPYCGIDQEGSDSAGLWEDGVKSTLVQVYNYMKPVEEAIKNTRPSESYVTPAYSTINTVDWGVATESADGKSTYLHVLKAPEEDTLQIAAPADGKTFISASLLATGDTVEMVQDENGITLTLPEGTDWDALNTVIKLTVDKNSDLQSALKTAEKLLKTETPWLYSAETGTNLASVVKAAQAVLEDENASDEQIAEAAAKVRAAAEAYEATYVTDSVPGENYAAGKNASASSSLEESNFSINYLTDGNKLGEENRGWTSHPHSTTPYDTQYVEIDLESVQKIGRVDLTPCTDAGWGFPEDFKIEVSEDGKTYEEVFSMTGYKSDGSVFQAHFAALNARYVKITGTKQRPDQENGQSYRMQFSEVEVYPMSVEEAAYRIESVQTPEKGAEKLALPEAPEGFTVSGITYSSDAAVISEDGTIHTPDKDTIVDLQFNVVRNSDRASALTRILSVTVKGSDDEDDGSTEDKPDPNPGEDEDKPGTSDDNGKDDAGRNPEVEQDNSLSSGADSSIPQTGDSTGWIILFIFIVMMAASGGIVIRKYMRIRK